METPQYTFHVINHMNKAPTQGPYQRPRKKSYFLSPSFKTLTERNKQKKVHYTNNDIICHDIYKYIQFSP